MEIPEPLLPPNQLQQPTKNEGLFDVATRPGYCPDLARYFPPGAAKSRLEEYFSKYMPRNESKLGFSYWSSLFDDFYVPTGTMRMLLLNDETKQRQRFDIAKEFLPHFFTLCFAHNMRVMRMQFTDINEYLCDPSRPPAPPTGSYEPGYPTPLVLGGTTHIVEAKNVLLCIVYANGWQCQAIGSCRALFAPYSKVRFDSAPPGVKGNAEGKVPRLHTQLRVQYLCFNSLSKRIYVPFDEMLSHLESRVIPRQVVENIISYGNKRKKEPYEDRPEDYSSKRQHQDKSDLDVSRSSEESVDQKPPSPQADRDSIHEDAQLPTFTLNQPRLNALRFLDGFGIPQHMNQTVTVRTTYSKLTSQMMDTIAQLRTLLDIHMEEGRSPLQVMEEFNAQSEKQHSSFASKNSDHPPVML